MKKVNVIIYIFIFLLFSFGIHFLVNKAQADGCCWHVDLPGVCHNSPPTFVLFCDTNYNTVYTCAEVASAADCTPNGSNSCAGRRYGDPCNYSQATFVDTYVCNAAGPTSTFPCVPGPTTSPEPSPGPDCSAACKADGYINGFVISSAQPCDPPNVVSTTDPRCCCFPRASSPGPSP